MMNTCIKNALVYENGSFIKKNYSLQLPEGATVDCLGVDSALCVLPGFVDVHVHFREPGFCYKETMRTGSLAAAHGGYQLVMTMPNLNPVPDSMAALAPQLEAIKKDACIHVIPYGTITRGAQGQELSDMEALAPHVFAFSDDGKGVQSDDMMRAAMKKAKALGKVICAHCEDNSLLRGGYIHDGEYARAHGHAGICSESEWGQIARDLELVRETGCAYHVCHISCKESVALIRKAKAEGLDVSCETGPHYLLLNDSQLQEEGRFKMNPPIRAKEDQQALIEGLLDGTIDTIATDHAPHSAEEKSKGLKASPMGIVGLETAFPLLYTHLVKKGVLSFEKLMQLMHDNPLKRFGLTDCGGVTVFDLNKEYVINPDDFESMGKSTPFAGEKVSGECLLTLVDGKIAWQKH